MVRYVLPIVLYLLAIAYWVQSGQKPENRRGPVERTMRTLAGCIVVVGTGMLLYLIWGLLEKNF